MLWKRSDMEEKEQWTSMLPVAQAQRHAGMPPVLLPFCTPVPLWTVLKVNDGWNPM